jgi:hypothetical protein
MLTLMKILTVNTLKKYKTLPQGNFEWLNDNSRKFLGAGYLIEGVGADTKAEINFENGGLKKLLLRFAKLSIIE